MQVGSITKSHDAKTGAGHVELQRARQTGRGELPVMSPVVVFDLFGTLLDIASIAEIAATHADDPAALVATWREKQIAYAFASSLMGRYRNFDDLTDAALRYALAKHGIALDDLAAEALGAAWTHLRPHDDALPLLDRLHADGLRAIVLTNGTPATANAALANAGLAPRIEAVLSVDDVGVYKPDPRVYASVGKRLGVEASDVLFVSANGWDATGAAAFGFRVAWCNRAGAPAETLEPAPTWTIASLDELVPELPELGR
jgi:2-haloacid dehalogenase